MTVPETIIGRRRLTYIESLLWVSLRNELGVIEELEAFPEYEFLSPSSVEPVIDEYLRVVPGVVSYRSPWLLQTALRKGLVICFGLDLERVRREITKDEWASLTIQGHPGERLGGAHAYILGDLPEVRLLAFSYLGFDAQSLLSVFPPAAALPSEQMVPKIRIEPQRIREIGSELISELDGQERISLPKVRVSNAVQDLDILRVAYERVTADKGAPPSTAQMSAMVAVLVNAKYGLSTTANSVATTWRNQELQPEIHLRKHGVLPA